MNPIIEGLWEAHLEKRKWEPIVQRLDILIKLLKPIKKGKHE